MFLCGASCGAERPLPKSEVHGLNKVLAHSITSGDNFRFEETKLGVDPVPAPATDDVRATDLEQVERGDADGPQGGVNRTDR